MTDEQWLTRLGYTQVTEHLWTRRGWPRVARTVDGQWGHVPARGEIIYRQTARELVRDVLFMRCSAARAAWDRAHARWQEAR